MTVDTSDGVHLQVILSTSVSQISASALVFDYFILDLKFHERLEILVQEFLSGNYIAVKLKIGKNRGKTQSLRLSGYLWNSKRHEILSPVFYLMKLTMKNWNFASFLEKRNELY